MSEIVDCLLPVLGLVAFVLALRFPLRMLLCVLSAQTRDAARGRTVHLELQPKAGGLSWDRTGGQLSRDLRPAPCRDD